MSGDEMALQPEVVQPAPSAMVKSESMNFDMPKRKELPKAEPKPKPEPTEEKQEQPVTAPLPIEVSEDKRQDPVDQSLFDKGSGHPKQDKKLQSSTNGRWYQIKADTFRGQKTFQTWMHAVGYYKDNERLNNPTNQELTEIGINTKK
jgi:outer membrane biosynthesis protein TonB